MSFDLSNGGEEDMVRYTIRAALSRCGHRDRARQAVNKLLEALPPGQQKTILNDELASVLKLGNLESARFVIDKGADIDHEDDFGRSIMHMSLHHDQFDFFEKGTQAGLDYSKRDRQGCEPIHHAASGNCVTGLRWLLDKSVDCNRTDNQGWTPLHWAALQGHDIIQLLLDAGSMTHMRDSKGRTALDIASAIRPADARLLRLLGADDDQVLAINHGAGYGSAEDAWYLHLYRSLKQIHVCHELESEEESDAQWDWDLSKKLATYCEYRDGECGTQQIGQLLSKPNQALYKAGIDRVATKQKDGTLEGLASPASSRPTFCDCCGYVSCLQFCRSLADTHADLL